MKRIFLALSINLSERSISFLEELKLSLKKEKIRWVDLNNMHITLKFLGDTEEFILPKINELLSKSFQHTINPFKFELNGIGIFRSIHRPRVLWIGLTPQNQLNKLHEIINNTLNNSGIEISNNNFSPHLTLGRMKHISDKNNLNNILSDFNTIVLQEIIAEELIIYESVLKQTGPVYNELYRIRFNAECKKDYT